MSRYKRIAIKWRAALSFSLVFVVLTLAGCATLKRQQKTTPSAAPKEKAEPVIAATSLPDEPLPETEIKVLTKDFRDELVSWIQKTRKINYSRVAQQIQKYIKDQGLLYSVDIKDLLPSYKGYRSFELLDKKRVHISTANSFEGPCGEVFVKISVLGFENGAPVLLTNQGPVAAKGIWLEKTLIRTSEYQQNGTVIYRPGVSGPWNVTNDGQAILWHYDLKQSLMIPWWQKLARRYRELREEHPFAVIRIDANGFKAETYEKLLLPGAFEHINPNDTHDQNLIRKIYKPKKIVVDYEGACT